MIYPSIYIFYSHDSYSSDHIVRRCADLLSVYFYARFLVTDFFLKASLSVLFFSEHREYFPNPCLSLPPITGANVILSIKLLTVSLLKEMHM